MMQANHTTPMPTVMRSRLRSATDDPPRRAGDAAAEHVGQAAAPALVQQDQQDHAAELVSDEHDGEERVITAEAYVTSVAIGQSDRHVVEPADAGELVGLEAGTADQAAVDVRAAP